MTTLASSGATQHSMGWLRRSEAWLDDKGKGAWIAAMVLAFIFFWPVGLALLAFMIWSGKMSCNKTRRARGAVHMSRTTGNTAFDAYRDDTLARLEQEQEAFEAFLDRLRQAKDKSEFDQFMDERAKSANAASDTSETRDA